ncbi:SPOR domain-containing protein [Thermohalobacter berrensis]|uniref:SPOR domain-containing protein n=1 Tax=Thermohalobacter berrensis TaxID=99594 RepID=A0A419T6J0_9FIRM|nr:SPOR domain-containing protein [Thermohalobacter berrensis]RKD33184.1 hypothetical protein BET03_09725 [Thermohalobacter berrensis]
MRRTRNKRKLEEKKYKLMNFLAFFVFAPAVSILLGIGVVKYFILPYLADGDIISVVKNKEIVNEENIQSKDTKRQENIEEEANNENMDKFMTLELNRLNIYNVQVGSFSTIDNAKNFVDNLNRKGYGAYIVKDITRNNGFKVFAASFFNRDKAEKILTKIKKDYSDAYIKTMELGEKKIKYMENDMENIKKIKELLSVVQSVHDDETSLWYDCINTGEIGKIKELIESNTVKIDNILNEIEDKIYSNDLQIFIKRIEEQVEKRNSIIDKLDEGEKGTILESYEEFNKIFFDYLYFREE